MVNLIALQPMTHQMMAHLEPEEIHGAKGCQGASVERSLESPGGVHRLRGKNLRLSRGIRIWDWVVNGDIHD